MKQVYFLLLLCFSILSSHSQNEQLEGVWVIDSIFDLDILLEFPDDSAFVTFENNNITIDSFCGETYVSTFINSELENTVEIEQTSWSPQECDEDTIGREVAVYNVFGNNDTTTVECTYLHEFGLGIETLQFSNNNNIAFAFLSRVATPPPPLIANQWYLHSITTSGVQHDNYIGDIGLDFTLTESPDIEAAFKANGGTPCEMQSIDYTVTGENSLFIYTVYASASCSSATVDGAYTEKYTDILTYPGDVSYAITGDNENTQLTLTNSEGDFAVYKTSPPTTTLFKTWYSYSTETVDGVSYPTPNINASLTLTKDEGFLGFYSEGLGGCNEFFASYNIYTSNQNEFDMYLFTQTLVICEDNLYEPTYFSVLGDEENATFSYDMSENGETLVLTNTNGDVLTFGSTPTSDDFLGQWYVHYLMIDSNQVTIPNPATTPTLIFETSANGLGFDFNGGVICSGYSGSYHLNPQQTFSVEELFVSLGDPCETSEENDFEDLYFYSVLQSDIPSEFSFEIIGTGNDAILIITNLSNGNQVILGRQVLSVENVAFEDSSIKLKSNPVQNSLNLVVNQQQPDLNYQIYSLDGKLVKENQLSSETIDVENLSSGLYFIRLSNNNYQQTIKFIKE
ncbi:T9SS type A sorting domain-containing protein [Psychroserpens sp. XS_ASV72]|uniref:T9SS type A sorting domain-containing protein n=1 Tax=Psychroserpens sp. XS_ASV72 TaxID=3241293 RepID=UPI0035196374